MHTSYNNYNIIWNLSDSLVVSFHLTNLKPQHVFVSSLIHMQALSPCITFLLLRTFDLEFSLQVSSKVVHKEEEPGMKLVLEC